MVKTRDHQVESWELVRPRHLQEEVWDYSNYKARRLLTGVPYYGVPDGGREGRGEESTEIPAFAVQQWGTDLAAMS